MILHYITLYYAIVSAIIIIILCPPAQSRGSENFKQNVKTTAATTSYSVFIVLRKETAFSRCRIMDRR